MEEGESELLCYFCGMEFRTRKYFLRHHEEHMEAEIGGVPMSESTKGLIGEESIDSFSESSEEESAPQPVKKKQMKKKKKKDLREQEKRREERKRQEEKEG